MESQNYFLVTPCKNEEENLLNLITSIKAQTVQPVVWAIVNDGSSDGTWEIISEASKECPWIKGINLVDQGEYMGKHYASVVNAGFRQAAEYCRENKIACGYIGLIDADNIPEKGYFERLIKEFQRDPSLGILSGVNAWADIPGVLIKLKEQHPDADVTGKEFWRLFGTEVAPIQDQHDDKPMGSARLWRRQCFEESGNGYYPGFAPDSISTVKATLKGWKTKRIREARVVERQGTISQGLWGGGVRVGRFDYFLGRPLYFGILRSIRFLIKRGVIFSTAHFYGFIRAYVTREPRIDDLEIQKYYRHSRIHELKSRYLNKIRVHLEVWRNRI